MVELAVGVSAVASLQQLHAVAHLCCTRQLGQREIHAKHVTTRGHAILWCLLCPILFRTLGLRSVAKAGEEHLRVLLLGLGLRERRALGAGVAGRVLEGTLAPVALPLLLHTAALTVCVVPEGALLSLACRQLWVGSQ